MNHLPRARLSPVEGVGSRRARVVDALTAAMESTGIVVLAAPAGAGKTRAAAHLVESTDRPVIWYRAGAADADAQVFFDHLNLAAAEATGSPPPLDGDASSLIATIERLDDGRVLVVIDEVDTLGPSATAALDELLLDLPGRAAVLLLSRTAPDLNMSLLEVRSRLSQIPPDVLRFRTWEIDRLFADVYGVKLAPYELAEIERRTGGWAAGLHLFHLVTKDGGPERRRDILDAIGGRRGPAWEFLKRNVVESLTPELRAFLFEVVGFGRLRAGLCDELRGRNDSAMLLEELAARQLFVTEAFDGDGYLVHDVLGAHLRGRIVHQFGEADLARRHEAAAQLLEANDHLSEAFEVYLRAGRWDDAARLLNQRGPEMSERPTWLTDEVPDFLSDDPWWLLAVARRHRGAGRLAAAIEVYFEVEANDLSDAAADTARRERLQIVSYASPGAPAADVWIRALRDVLDGRPVALDPGVAEEALVGAIGSFLGRRPDTNRRLTESDRPELGDGFRVVAVGLLALNQLIDALDHRATASRLGKLVDVVDEGWLRSFGLAVLGIVEGDPEPARSWRSTSGDHEMVRCVADALVGLLAARHGRPERPDCDRHAGIARWFDEAAARIASSASLLGTDPVASAVPISIGCFGGFELLIDGAEMSLDDLRPRAREVLRLLAAHGGDGVHQDVLCAALWPEDDDDRARPKLQTAVSAARRCVEAATDGRVGVGRIEHSYRLEVGADVEFDVRRFRALVRSEDADDLRAGLELSATPLLPESGSADWVVEARIEMTRLRVDAAVALGQIRRADHDPVAAVEAYARGLDSDPYEPSLWSALLEACEAADDASLSAYWSALHSERLAELETA